MIALGIPAQAVIGGITVHTDLNPWVVALHLLVSMAIIGACVLLLDGWRAAARVGAPWAGRAARLATFAVGWVVLYLGTVVTGSGPHSGDEESRRTGLDPGTCRHVHAGGVYALVALTLGPSSWPVARHRRCARRRAVLLASRLARAVIGFTQYFPDLPIALVCLHMLGAALISAALAWVAISTRAHQPTR